MTVYELLKRKNRLEKIIVRLQTDLKNLPEGKLLIKHNSTRGEQFYINKTCSGKPKYLSIKQDGKIISKLAQKAYIKNVLKEAETELKLLTNLLNHETNNSIASIYDNMDNAIKPFINPVEISVQEKIRLFEQRIPKDKQFIKTGQYLIKTTRGEYVKSMAEFIIAETLFKYKVPYIYEDILRTADHRIVKPDFTAINLKTGKIILWEHLGMLEKPDYREDNTGKLYSYSLSGIYPGNRMIVTISTKEQPLKESQVETIIRESFLK